MVSCLSPCLGLLHQHRKQEPCHFSVLIVSWIRRSLDHSPHAVFKACHRELQDAECVVAIFQDSSCTVPAPAEIAPCRAHWTIAIGPVSRTQRRSSSTWHKVETKSRTQDIQWPPVCDCLEDNLTFGPLQSSATSRSYPGSCSDLLQTSFRHAHKKMGGRRLQTCLVGATFVTHVPSWPGPPSVNIGKVTKECHTKAKIFREIRPGRQQETPLPSRNGGSPSSPKMGRRRSPTAGQPSKFS